MIEFDIDAQGIATLTIQQTQRAMNVIDWVLTNALSERIDQIAQDPAVTGVILTSGKSSFVAGADLAIMTDFVAPGVTPNDAAKMIARIGSTLRRLETLGKPVVGASTGTALGGGLEILLACHYRVAADVPGAVYGLPEVSLGLLPGAGGTQRLPRLVGMAKALPLMLSGRHIKTSEALTLGLLDQVVPAEELLSTAKKALLDGRVSSMAPWDQKGFRLPGGDSNNPAANELFLLLNGDHFGRTHGLQPAPKAIASCVYEGSRLPIDRALRIEQMYFAQLVQGHEAQAMIKTLFFARQALEKASGRPTNVPRAKLSKVAIAGSAPWQEGLRKAAEAAGLTVLSEGNQEAELQIGEGDGQIALRWFQTGTSDLPPVVEVAPSAGTTDEQLARAYDLSRQLRAVPVSLRASAVQTQPPQYVCACIKAALSVACRYAENGASPVVLNNTLTAQGWPALPVLAAAIGEEWPVRDLSAAKGVVVLDTFARDVADAVLHVAQAATVAAELTPEAANLAAVLGAGYPRHLGGPMFAANCH